MTRDFKFTRIAMATQDIRIRTFGCYYNTVLIIVNKWTCPGFPHCAMKGHRFGSEDSELEPVEGRRPLMLGHDWQCTCSAVG